MAGKYARGLETELKILRQFANNKEVYQYTLHEKVGVSYRTTLRTLHSLKKRGWLQIVRKEESDKKGKERNVWAITFRGLLNLLAVDEEVWQQIESIAEEQQKLLPLILGKWQHFKRCGVEDEQLSKMLKWLFYMAWQKRLEKGEFVMPDFSMYVFNMTVFKERIHWLKAIHDDPELKPWALEEERSFLSYAATLTVTFRLIRKSNPDWEEGLRELRRVARMSMRVYSEEERERLEKQFLEQLEGISGSGGHEERSL